MDDERLDQTGDVGPPTWRSWVASSQMAGEVPGFDRIDSVVEVGRGGNAVVYRGTERAFDRTVAVKVLSHRLVDDAERQRFERECKAVGGLSGHPNVVVVYSAGETGDGHPYIVMEYLPRSLADRLVGEGRIDWREACEIGRAVGGALAAAHDRGVLHRDIKPENVLLTAAGVPKLTDFGLARLAGGYESETTNVRASLTHAAPELFEGHTVNEATDVYSLASTIHHLISGRAPFVRPGDVSIITVVNRVLREPPPELSPFGVPPAVEAVLVRAMSKESSNRYGSVREFLAALSAAIEQPHAPVVAPLTVTVPDRKRWLVGAIAAAVLVVGAIVAVAAMGDDDPASADPTPSAAADTTDPTPTTEPVDDTEVTVLTTMTTAPPTTTGTTVTGREPLATLAESSRPTAQPPTATTSPATTLPPASVTTTTRPATATSRPGGGTTAPVVTAAPTTAPVATAAPATDPPVTTTPPTPVPTTAPPTTRSVPNLIGASTSAAASALQQQGFAGMDIVPGSCDASSTITGYTPQGQQPLSTRISVWCN